MSLVLSLPDNYLSRAPQEQARRAVEQAVLAGEKSISYAMPTGTGKTRVLLALLVALFVRGFQRFIIVLPNLNLLDQVKRHYMEVLGWAGVFYVCSEPGTDAEAEADKDAIDEAYFRRSYPAASEAELREIYAREQFLIVTTYASLPKVLPATQPVDALFLDEAHHEEGPVVLKALQDHSAKYKHKISASATLLPSHQPCYTYSLSAAIHDNIIKDYELFICLISTLSTAQSKIKFIKDIVAKTGNTHLIHYTAFSEADRDGATSVRKVVAELSGDPTVWVKGLTGAHSREERQAIIKAFAAPLKGKQVVKLLVNCRVLGEGADIGAANGIVFDKTTADATQLQQNIGRALRKPDGATVKAAAILFMIQIDAEELAAVAPGAERNAALVEQVYDSGPGHLAMVAIAALLKQDPAKLRELMAGNQRFAFTRARPDLAVVETTKETVLLTQPDEDNDFDDTNGLADAITMGTDWPAAEVQNILRDLAEGSERGSSYDEDEDSDRDGEDGDESRDEGSESSSEEPEPFVQRLSDRLGCDVVIHYADSTMVASQPVGAYDETLELLKTPTGYDLVVPAADKDNERYAAATAKTHKKGRPVNFMLEQELKELVSLRLSDDTDLTHGLTARLEVSVNAKTQAEMKSAQLALFFKAVEKNGVNALIHSARVNEEGQLVASGGWPIGQWFSDRKKDLKRTPSKKAAVYAMLTQNGTNEIVTANLDKFLAPDWYHDLTNDGKFALFFKAVENCGANALRKNARVNEEGQLVASDGWKIGSWFNTQKTRNLMTPSKKDTLYASLTQDGTNEIVKAHLDKFLAKQAQPEEWYESKSFSDEKKLALFIKTTAAEMNGAKALEQKAQVDEEGQLVATGGWKIGAWFDRRKHSMKKDPSKKDAVYDELTQDGTNEIVKAHLDKFLAGQDQPEEWYHSLSKEDMVALFHKSVELNGVKALKLSARVNEEGQLVASEGWKIGSWFSNQKTRKLMTNSEKEALYAMLTQNGTNKIVKAHLDKFFEYQAKYDGKFYKSKFFGDKEQQALFLKAVEMNGANALLHNAQVDEEGQLVASGGWPIGPWVNTKKMSMKDPSKQATVYDLLTQDGTNEIVKAHLDKFLAKQAQPEEWYESKSFSDEKKLALFIKTTAVENCGAKALAARAQVDAEGQLVATGGWKIGTWFDARKHSMKDSSKQTAVYDELTQGGTNKIVKANLDKFLVGQAKPAEWYHSLSDEAKLALFFKTVEINGDKALASKVKINERALSQKTQVNEEGQLVASDGWPIGFWFQGQKQNNLKKPSKKAAVYAMLTQNGTNKIVKAHLDKFLAEQKKKKRKASDVADEEQEDTEVVVAAPAEPPKKRQKTSAAAAQPAAPQPAPAATAATAAPQPAPAPAATAAPQPAPAATAAPAAAAPAPAPASRKRLAAAAAALEEQEQQEEQPKPKRARKQPAAPPAPKEPLTYNELSEAAKKEIIERHLRQQQQKPAAGYRTTNPEAKDTINGVLARYVPAVGDGKVIFLDHTEFKTAYALLETGRVRPEDMLIPQHKPADYEKMACHELFGGFVVQGDFNSVLETFLAEGGVVRSVYADYCSTLQADGLPFVALLAQHRDKLVPEAVVGLTLTRRNPEGVCYAGQDIVKMNTALWRLLQREPENLFHTTQMAWADGQPLGDGDPFTYGAGQPMVTWLIR